MSPEIVVTDEPGTAVYEIVRSGLIAFNEAKAGAGNYRPLAVLVRENAATTGGLWGATHWSWLYIELFWLPERMRGKGLGRDILARAEAEARQRGYRAAWLDTFAFQAPAFYERQGYRVFGLLEDYPPGHRRYFLQKALLPE